MGDALTSMRGGWVLLLCVSQQQGKLKPRGAANECSGRPILVSGWLDMSMLGRGRWD